MNNRFESPPLRDDLIRDLRAMVERGAKVRELANEINTRVSGSEPSVLLTLAYFRRAFCLPLPIILPLREWLGTDNDDEINALLLPEIEKAKGKWSKPVGTTQ